MSFNGGGLAAPGVRVKRELTEQSEVWTNVKIAAIVVVLCDLILTVVLLTAIKTGWWACPILGLIVGFLVGMSGLMFAERLRIGLGRWASLVLGNMSGILCFVGFGIGYLGRTKVDPAIKALGDQVWGMFEFEWWMYAGGALLLVVFSVVVRNWKAVGVFAVAEVVAGLVLTADARQYAQIWRVLSWIGLVYLWPMAGVAMVLAAKLMQEMVLPSLEFILKPFSLEEYREVGAGGLLLPRLLGQKDKPEKNGKISERRVRVESKENEPGELAQETYTYLPDSDSARDFYRALSKGAPFTQSEAQRWGVGRKTFENKIRDVFLDPSRRWAVWKNAGHHDQGLELTRAGNEKIEALVLGDPRH